MIFEKYRSYGNIDFTIILHRLYVHMYQCHWFEVPQMTLGDEMDVTSLLSMHKQLRANALETTGVKLTLTAYLIKGTLSYTLVNLKFSF